MKNSTYTSIGMVFTAIGTAIFTTSEEYKYFGIVGPAIGLIIMFYGHWKNSKDK